MCFLSVFVNTFINCNEFLPFILTSLLCSRPLTRSITLTWRTVSSVCIKSKISAKPYVSVQWISSVISTRNMSTNSNWRISRNYLRVLSYVSAQVKSAQSSSNSPRKKKSKSYLSWAWSSSRVKSSRKSAWKPWLSMVLHSRSSLYISQLMANSPNGGMQNWKSCSFSSISSHRRENFTICSCSSRKGKVIYIHKISLRLSV